MLVEWSVECGAEDPVLVVPWKDPNTNAAFVDLLANPYDFDNIPEAEQYPPLMQALRALNATRSPVFTAKCDAWQLDGEERSELHNHLDIFPTDAPDGFASYIDMVCRDRSLFASFPGQERLLRRLTRQAAALDHPAAALDCVLRPALIDLDGAREGYAISLYVKALGANRQTAFQQWGAALEAVVALVRAKDFAR